MNIHFHKIVNQICNKNEKKINNWTVMLIIHYVAFIFINNSLKDYYFIVYNESLDMGAHTLQLINKLSYSKMLPSFIVFKPTFLWFII